MRALALFDQGPFPPCPRPFNMAGHTFSAADRAPERVALEVLSAPGAVSARWTHATLAEAVRRTAGGLAARGLGKGDRVLLRIGASVEFPILFFAANALGAIPVPTSALLTEPEVSDPRRSGSPADLRRRRGGRPDRRVRADLGSRRLGGADGL